jgi:hypothetical protein
MVAAWSVDRLSRSLHDLTGILKDLHSLNVDLYLHQQGLDTSTPTGKAMFQMVGVFAELERAVIRERVMAGIARAKAQGKKLGRRRTDGKTERRIEHALSRGDRGTVCSAVACTYRISTPKFAMLEMKATFEEMARTHAPEALEILLALARTSESGATRVTATARRWRAWRKGDA